MKKLNRKTGLLLLVICLAVSLVSLLIWNVSYAKVSSLPKVSQIANREIEPREITYRYRGQLFPALEDLVTYEQVLIAIVVPVERKSAIVVSDAELVAMRGDAEKQRIQYFGSSPSGNPFTPIEINVVEGLKGDLQKQLEVWEERGKVAGFEVESDDPQLSVGVKGLLIAGRYDNGVIAPLIFAPIQDDGYMPALQMSLTDFRKMLKQ